jgi:hypothetical protein
MRLTTSILLLLVLCGLNYASDRARQPLNVAIAQADAIVVGKTTKVVTALHPTVEDVAEVEVISLLKGAVGGRSLTLRMNPFLDHGPERLVADRRYILFLSQNNRSASAFELMSDGTRPYEEAAADQIAEAVKLMPRWSRPGRGVAMIAVPEKFTYKLGEAINLMVGYKNLSAAEIVLRYRDWPLDAHSHWTLEIRSQGGGIIPPTPHPHLSRGEITEYFSRHGNSFTMPLKPGQSFFIHVDRINSAEPGWGYKERLDFKYYPITERGRYSIRVTGHNLYGGTSMTAEGFQIWVE